MNYLKKMLLGAGSKDRSIIYVGGIYSGCDLDANITTMSLTNLSGGISSRAAAGDIVIVIRALSKNGTGGATVNDPAGYIRATRGEENDNFSSGINVSYKIMLATPDTNVELPNDNEDNEAVMVRVYRNVDETTPMDVPANYYGRGDYAEPNPPAITPITEGALVIAAGVGSFYSTTEKPFTSPDLDNFIGDSFVGASNDSIAFGSGIKEDVIGEFNPGAFDNGVGGSGENNSNGAITLALRPKYQQ